LESNLLVSIGGISFAIYCFQYPIYFMFEVWQFRSTGINAIYLSPLSKPPTVVSVPSRLTSAYFMSYLVCLVIFSGVWTNAAEVPFANKLSNFAKRTVEKPSKHRNIRVRNSQAKVAGSASIQHRVPPVNAKNLEVLPTFDRQPPTVLQKMSTTSDSSASRELPVPLTYRTGVTDQYLVETRKSLDPVVPTLSLADTIDNGAFMCSMPSAHTHSREGSAAKSLAGSQSGALSASQDFDGYLTDQDDDLDDDDSTNHTFGSGDGEYSDRVYRTARQFAGTLTRREYTNAA
jgi:hypothetical protein